MAGWIITITVIVIGVAGIVMANFRMGKIRKDGRPNQVPWGMVMVFCVLAIFMAVVHGINLAGFETGPEHSLLGRFGR
ncbi:hypothetical protein [Henriciella sp.]|uniref:hypothetical protein n=1 Tax=Henriciella sp. TaxID=1968823 RepID=UPI0026021DB3|nr:hypothetical protein [Henriciella sp.]